jgi:hypothetical protein
MLAGAAASCWPPRREHPSQGGGSDEAGARNGRGGRKIGFYSLAGRREALEYLLARLEASAGAQSRNSRIFALYSPRGRCPAYAQRFPRPLPPGRPATSDD